MLIEVKLENLLKEKRYTKLAVAESTGLHINTISKICNNKTHGIKFEVLEKLCNFLDCKIEDIIEYKKDLVA